MTLQEIKERIAVYESKWGKLGHTNIMKPENELQHSELNERRNTMIKTTNDFYKFRQKVAIGKEANKLAHKATISPEELNERNFQNQIDNNTLIHAGKNFKYVVKEDVNGKPRYFYTQEEYDAFKNNGKTAGNAGDMAGRLMKSAANDAFKNTGKSAGNAGDMAGRLMKSAANDVFKPENDRSKSVENYNNNARAALVSGIVEISKNGGSKAAADAMKDNSDYKLYMQMIQHAIDNGVDPKDHTVEETGKLLGKDYADAIKDAENNLREYFDAVPGLKDDLAKIALDDLAEMRKKNKKGTVLESVGNKLGEDLGKGIAKSNIGEAVTKNIKHSAFDEEDETPSCKTAADLRQEREESIMSEYRAFKARANKGAEKNRLSHSAVISPRDLNAKYEEELMKEYIAIHPENDDDIEHSSNGRAYINKIDKYYPDGSARYFYTQAEWDAYQDGLGQQKKADAPKKAIAEQKNNMAGYAEWKKEQEAKSKADERNNMDGYADWKKEQDAKKAEERKEISKKNDAGREAAIKAGQKAEQDRQEKAEIQRKNDLRKEDSNTEKILDEVITRLNTNYKDFRNKLDNALPDNFKRSKGSFNYEYKNKEYDDKIKEVSRKWNDLNNDRDEEGNIKHLDEMNKLSSEWADLENAKNKAKYSELMSAISSIIEDYSPSEKRNIYSDLAYFLNGPGYTSRYKENDFKMNAEVKDFLNELAAKDSIKNN